MRATARHIVASTLLALCCTTLAHAGVVHDGHGNAVEPETPADARELAPNGKGWGHQPDNAKNGGNGNAGTKGSTIKYPNGINYRGGPLILGTTNVYYIWYGNWSGNSAPTILNNLAASIGGSPYYGINTTYYDANRNYVTNAVQFMGGISDNYSQGTALSDNGVAQVVANAIASGTLPRDTNAVYFVLTSADVNETSGFCTQYCGWHSHATIAGADIKLAFVGNPDRCPSACAAQTTGPNGNAGADGMASIIAHELEEAVTDPDLNAWYDSQGRENADKCAWKFGSVYSTANGAKANMQLGGMHYLIQQNWVNAGGGYCALSYP